MIGNGRVYHLSRFVFHKDQHIEGFEKNAVDDCVVTRPYVAGVILQEGFPILTRSSPHLFHVLPNGMFVHLYPQLELFILNLFGSPERIFSSHLPDEVNGLLRNAGLVALCLGFPPPIPAKEVAMPSQECLRLHDV